MFARMGALGRSGLKLLKQPLVASRVGRVAFSGGLNRTATRVATPHVRVALGALGASVVIYNWRQEVAEACGIVAYVGKDPAVGYLLEGLHILQNRGYDSAGITTIHNGELVTTKFASVESTSDCIEKLNKIAPSAHPGDEVGIAHTRWATHGGKTDANAHPHLDQANRIAVVHNGTIENMTPLKQALEKKGVVFRSETDTEVISQMIGLYLVENPKASCVEAVKKTLAQLEGTWGLVILDKLTPGQIIAARNGSPLVIGVGEGRMFVASEPVAFARHTNQFISLKDGEVAVIKADSQKTLDLSRVKESPKENIAMSPDPFPHWTIKEINEQPEAIARTLGYGGRFDGQGNVKFGGLDENKTALLGIKNLTMAACGTSYFACLYGAAIMRSLKSFDTVQVFDAAEYTLESIPTKDAGLVVVSQSGETKDTHRSLMLAKDQNVPVFSVVNQIGSLIARTTNCGVYLNAGREHAVASTKAFTTQVTVLSMIAAWFSQNRPDASKTHTARAELVEAVHRLPIYTGMTLGTHAACREVAQKIVANGNRHIFVLGKGLGEPIAREGALKIKEISYIHAEGYSGGALKHGPFALLDETEKTPVVFIILDDQHADLMRTAAHETKARGTYNIVITDNPQLAEGVAHTTITIPSNGQMTALLATVPLQLLAYEMSIARGINPDKPRHLAKAVTVD